ncbi:MAG: DUF2158 domain-containing protein [Deltaproteobacteria bacterium]|nr:DUF2158 domain-containing protein [Deltaproteobacteria bacterium]
MTDQIKKGDVVQLKSGGPQMTVTDIIDEGGYKTVHCRFFDKNKNLQVAEFDELELAFYKAPIGVVRLHRG